MSVAARTGQCSETEHDHRYERKFVAASLTAQQIELAVRRHRAMFSEIYRERWINNIYLDTLDLKSYYASANGVASRSKTRVRWYGEPFGLIERPVLERKIKRGHVGRKESFALRPFELTRGFGENDVILALRASKLPPRLVVDLETQKPRLINRYSRKYFRSADGKFRITLDSRIRSQGLRSLDNQLPQWSGDPSLIVVELKYRFTDDANEADITQQLPFRVCRSSKYVDGMLRAFRLPL